MTIAEDEILKAACHGIVIGCLLPVLAYNLSAKKLRNIVIYSALVGYEVFNVIEHLHDARIS